MKPVGQANPKSFNPPYGEEQPSPGGLTKLNSQFDQESIMLGLHTPNPHPSHVMALFKDGIEVFDLPKGATLIELAERIEELAASHSETPVAINVQLDSPRTPGATGNSQSDEERAIHSQCRPRRS